MSLSPRQFWKSYQESLHAADNPEPGVYPNGSPVTHVSTGRTGTVTAQHKGNQNVNVQWKPGDVTVEHIGDLRG